LGGPYASHSGHLRIPRDLADHRLYVVDGRADYGVLEPMIGGVANFALIEENWGEHLRELML